MLLLLVIKFKHYKHNNPLRSAPLRWMYLLIVLFFISSSYAVFPNLHSQALIDFIKLGVTMTAIFMLCTEKKHLDYIMYGHLYGAWYLGFYIYQTGRNVGGRVEGVGPVDSPDANGTAATLVPTIVISCYYLWIKTNIYHRGLLVIGAVFSANALVLISSRGSFLAVSASMCYFMFFMFFSKYKINNQKKMATAFIVLTLIGASVLVDQAFIDRILTIKDAELVEDQQTGSTRVFFWFAAIEMARDYPFGQGFSGFIYHSDNYIPTHIDTGTSRNRAVHSTWFEALTQVGYPGLLTFIFMIIAALRCTWKIKKQLINSPENYEQYYKIIAIEAALLGYLVTATFLNRMRAEILYWCILYCAVAYNLYITQQEKLSTPTKTRG